MRFQNCHADHIKLFKNNVQTADLNSDLYVATDERLRCYLTLNAK